MIDVNEDPTHFLNSDKGFCNEAKTPKNHADLRCATCGREMDPNWISRLRSLISGAVEGSLKDMQNQHPTELPDNWKSGFTKRLVGQIVSHIWEIERGLCNLRKVLNREEKDIDLSEKQLERLADAHVHEILNESNEQILAEAEEEYGAVIKPARHVNDLIDEVTQRQGQQTCK